MQDEQALKYGDKWVETDRLYTKWNGEPMQNGTPYFWLNEFCEKHGLPFYGIHSFRHRKQMKTPLSNSTKIRHYSPCDYRHRFYIGACFDRKSSLQLKIQISNIEKYINSRLCRVFCTY